MTNIQRMKSDMATMDKREVVDRAKVDSRGRNDEATQERRFKADEAMNLHRIKNDEITADRREVKDANTDMALAISLSALAVLAVGAFFILI